MIAENTKVTRSHTLRQLHEILENGGTLKIRACDEEDRLIFNSTPKDIVCSGVLPTIQINTRLGYVLQANGDQRLLCADGKYHKVRTLGVGSSLFVNGKLVAYKRLEPEKLQKMYVQDGMSTQQIAEATGADYLSVRAQLKVMGIFRTRMNDAPIGKYDYKHAAAKTIRPAVISREDARPAAPEIIRVGQARMENKTCEVCARNGGRSVSPALLTGVDFAVLCDNCEDKLLHGWYLGRYGHLDTIAHISEGPLIRTFAVTMPGAHRNYVAAGFIAYA